MNYIDKNFLLNESKTFCMIPFIHFNTIPDGKAFPCCISAAGMTVGNTNEQTIQEVINSSEMNLLRTDILSERQSPYCQVCYQHEESGIRSFRQGSNKDYGKYFDTDVLESIQQDGSLSDFKMRYFDIRFSNICNMKCRTCGPDFSSQWEQEFKINWPNKYRIIQDNRKPELLEELKTHIPTMDTAYFAGGEPLITEEHYILLEEMIRQNRHDINLRYNTNLSNLKFKDKDLLELWKNFDKVSLSVSIDHYGKRAEYIRKGTNWEKELENLKKVKELDYIDFNINTVVSVFNYLTIDEFYYYLIDNGLMTPKDHSYSLYNMMSPKHLTAHILPKHLKEIAHNKHSKLYSYLYGHDYKPDQLRQVHAMTEWAESKDLWEVHKTKFQNETKIIDEVRGESFVDVFPELAELMDE